MCPDLPCRCANQWPQSARTVRWRASVHQPSAQAPKSQAERWNQPWSILKVKAKVKPRLPLCIWRPILKASSVWPILGVDLPNSRASTLVNSISTNRVPFCLGNWSFTMSSSCQVSSCSEALVLVVWWNTLISKCYEGISLSRGSMSGSSEHWAVFWGVICEYTTHCQNTGLYI